MDDKTRRRLGMGFSTLFGLRTQGFFTPYRYADQVRAPTGYPELEAIFEAARPAMRTVLDRVAAASGDLARLAGPPPIPRWDQSWFPRMDGAAACAILRDGRPRRIVEVGSGHSTRMLAHAAPDARITCIDPEPRADIAALDLDLRREVLASDHLPLFDALGPGDVAFFDSSHILWPGTDVDIILNRILPRLAPGVLIHFHDILLPDPYPPDWSWRGYTEQNGVGALLLGAVEIVFSSHFALTRMDGASAVEGIPLPEGAFETSLWLRRRS